jgi:hypothetical protein
MDTAGAVAWVRLQPAREAARRRGITSRVRRNVVGMDDLMPVEGRSFG